MEYALSKNIDVAFWLQYRKSIGEPPLVEALDFVIINEQLHDDFDSFKKTEIRPRFSYVPAIELVSLFCKCADIMVADIMVPCVIRYENDYYELDESQFDELVVWVHGLRHECKSTGCVKLFKEYVADSRTGK